jgi:hypothetical protein
MNSSQGPYVIFRNKLIFLRGEELLAPRPTSKLEDHPMSAEDCLFNIFAVTSITGYGLLRPQLEDAQFRGDKGPT